MNHRLSLTEFVITIGLLLTIAAACSQYFASELVNVVEQAFALVPKRLL